MKIKKNIEWYITKYMLKKIMFKKYKSENVDMSSEIKY